MSFIDLDWYKKTLEVLKKLIPTEPTADDAMKLLSTMDVVTPAGDSDGALFTDKKGNIYIL